MAVFALVYGHGKADGARKRSRCFLRPSGRKPRTTAIAFPQSAAAANGKAQAMLHSAGLPATKATVLCARQNLGGQTGVTGERPATPSRPVARAARS